MSKLREILEHALLMENQPGTQADAVISYVREQLENLQNPHRALELELARLVEAKTPPNGEFYKTRADKSELAVAFFHRVYKRFYKAGVLYSHELRTIDRVLYDNLLKAKDRPNLPKKQDMVDRDLRRINGVPALKLPRLAVASRRRALAVGGTANRKVS